MQQHTFKWRQKSWIAIFLVLAFVVLAGCDDDDDDLTFGSVSGTITFLDQMPDAGQISLNLLESEDVKAEQTIDVATISNNSLEFTFTEVDLGSYTIAIRWIEDQKTYFIDQSALFSLTNDNPDLSNFAITASFAAAKFARALSKATEFITNSQNADGGFPFRIEISQDSDFETTTWATRALLMTGADVNSPDIVSALNYIQEAQTDDGYYNEVNTAHSGFALLTLTEAGVEGPAVDAAVAWLKDAQQDDGGWGSGLTPPSMTIYTGVVMTALNAAGVPSTDPVMVNCVAFCENTQNMDGGWAMVSGDSWSMTTGWILQSLLWLGVDNNSDVIQNARAFLYSCQHEDGGFGQMPPTPSDPELTAYAMLPLLLLEGKTAEMTEAAYYLSDLQQDDGTYVSATPIEIENPEKNLQTTSFAVWALDFYLDSEITNHSNSRP
ncbi:MAG: hypothetical protein B6244_07545 [Candidatus Cloacimonetes bacterium 4572_55]|nr:MAG: hypothetical protein B6244_07545 [Candidatus Cloacimonetes bacterium 4572_55]